MLANHISAPRKNGPVDQGEICAFALFPDAMPDAELHAGDAPISHDSAN
jgi:hypothetical protein